MSTWNGRLEEGERNGGVPGLASGSSSQPRSLFVRLRETPCPRLWLSIVPPRAYIQQPSELQATTDTLLLFRLLNTPARKLRYLAIRIFIPTKDGLRIPRFAAFAFFPLFRIAALARQQQERMVACPSRMERCSRCAGIEARMKKQAEARAGRTTPGAKPCGPGGRATQRRAPECQL